MIATVTNQGKARWMIIDGAFNHQRLSEFFESLLKDNVLFALARQFDAVSERR